MKVIVIKSETDDREVAVDLDDLKEKISDLEDNKTGFKQELIDEFKKSYASDVKNALRFFKKNDEIEYDKDLFIKIIFETMKLFDEEFTSKLVAELLEKGLEAFLEQCGVEL